MSKVKIMTKNFKEAETEDTTIVGNPNLLLLGFGIITFLLSITIAYYTFNLKYFTEISLENSLVWVFEFFIVLLAFLSVYMILTLKKVTLTNTGLNISYPFLHSSRDISFDDVCKVYDQDYDIKGSHNYKLYDIYKGKKTIIEIYDAKNIVITSLEVSNYAILSQNLKNITKSYFKVKTNYYDTIVNTQRYGWFVFWVFFIYFLIAYIIYKKYS
ncbi:hypothetical protein [Flavobacterium piscisymbiosum]|uniref:Uncharacterized protein n=1 Tax=Flavobacterium piscisymbiosum TaxID=2893753 RepID=A0ABS8MMQ5_9FLAO|nr:hypothetical protein [Flavobacterium sp. F-30]MCC9066157.1 hypothetical protein [Flavobacterium sp. F-30]